MATFPGAVGRPPRIQGDGTSAGAFVDRWIYVFMAALFIVTALAGFVPTSIGKVMEVQAGIRPPLPIVLHVHATLMGAWLLLLLAQTSLMATGRRGMHMRLGMLGSVLAPAMVLTGFFLVPAMFWHNFAMLDAAPPEMAGQVATTRMFLGSLVAFQIAAGALFALFIVLGLRARRTDPGFHKRMMILATVVPLPAAIDRMAWLPTTYPESALAPVLYPILWIMPMLVWDLVRNRRVHRAYLVWFACYIPMAMLVTNLWWTPGWLDIAYAMMGYTP